MRQEAIFAAVGPGWRRLLALGAGRGVDPKSVGLVWEWMTGRHIRAVNGYPIFGSMRLMHKADVELVRPAITAEFKRRAAIEVPGALPHTPAGRVKRARRR